MNLNDLAKKLTKNYDIQEARSIVRLLLSDYFNISLTDICCGALERLSPENLQNLNTAIKRLEDGEPIQYIIGKSNFCDREFHVEPGVLIPRPETEELCDIITKACTNNKHPQILDIGTGSGCIAVTLALNLPHSTVSAWDISDDALRIAKLNAKNNGAEINFEKKDILNNTTATKDDSFDIIVSNPPYICRKEAADMEKHVLDHEPHLALFVPDDDPLLFYRAITKFAIHSLNKNGKLFFEINPIYANDTIEMMTSFGFKKTRIIQDSFGKNRFAYGELSFT